MHKCMGKKREVRIFLKRTAGDMNLLKIELKSKEEEKLKKKKLREKEKKRLMKTDRKKENIYSIWQLIITKNLMRYNLIKN